jgi:acyl transferase domain-containing protein
LPFICPQNADLIVFSNGKTNGITLPSATGQEAVIRKAYAKAGLQTDETDYVEVCILLRVGCAGFIKMLTNFTMPQTHTTGTPVGDPIEVEALSKVLNHKSGRPTLVGTVKANLGHSEAVSGICSIIKVTLALEHGLIPPTIGIKKINPNLRLVQRNVEVVTQLTEWPTTAVRRASVNSFGYGGANAHAILEAADFHIPPGYKARRPRTLLGKKFILPFSGHTQSSLHSRLDDLCSFGFESVDVVDLAYTLSRRSNLSFRGFLLAQEETLAQDVAVSNLRKLNTTSETRKLPFAFIFTGQGAQWPRMGFQLMEQFATYRKVIEDLDFHLSNLEYAPTWTIKGKICHK